MTVDAVVSDIESAAEKPLRIRPLPLEQLRKRLEPGDALAALAIPKSLEVVVVDLRLRVRLRREVRRGRKAPLLEEEVVNLPVFWSLGGSHRVVNLLSCYRQSGLPTGKTRRSAWPLITPAADVYQATAAVMIPAHPPA